MRAFISKNRWPLIVAALAVVVRVVYLLELSRLPEALVPMVDEKWHWLWANEILNESFWGTGAYFRAPLYPYFLALLSWITGASVLASKLLQVILCGGTAWFIYRLAEVLFDRKVALAAGLVYAFYGTLVLYESMFLIPVIFVFLMVWAMYRLVAYRDQAGPGTWFVTGLLFGLATLSRPNILIVVPFLMLWLIFTDSGSRALLKRSKRSLVMLAGLLVVIVPVTVRNVAVTGDLIFISSQGGINLYLGNNPEADGLTMLMPEVALDESVSWDKFEWVTRAAAEREAGRTLSESELSAFWTSKALDFIVSNPGHFLSLLWRKTVYLLSGFENSDNIDIYFQRDKSFLYSLLVWEKPIHFPFGLLLPLTLVGVYVTRKDFKKILPVYIFILAYIPSILLFLVTARHRLPLVPFMIIVAVGGIVVLLRSLKSMRLKHIVAVVALFLVPLVVFNRIYYEEMGVSDFQNYFNEGIRYEQLGNFERAEQAYMMADRQFPYSAALVNNLAHVQLVLGKTSQAERNFRRVVILDSSWAAAYSNLGLVMRQKGNADSALVLYQKAVALHDPGRSGPDELNQYLLNIAGAYEALGSLDSADAAYRRAIDSHPWMAEPYFKASGFYSRAGMYGAADSLFAAGQTLGEPSATDLFNWGLSFIKRQEFFAAVSRMHLVLEKDSSFYQAYYCIAVGFHENYLSPDSVNKYLDLTFRYNPDYRPALELKKMLSGGE